VSRSAAVRPSRHIEQKVSANQNESLKAIRRACEFLDNGINSGDASPRASCPPGAVLGTHRRNFMAPQESTALKAVSPATPLYRTAPHNIEAEQALLGAILINNDAFYRVSDFLKPAHLRDGASEDLRCCREPDPGWEDRNPDHPQDLSAA